MNTNTSTHTKHTPSEGQSNLIIIHNFSEATLQSLLEYGWTRVRGLGGCPRPGHSTCPKTLEGWAGGEVGHEELGIALHGALVGGVLQAWHWLAHNTWQRPCEQKATSHHFIFKLSSAYSLIEVTMYLFINSWMSFCLQSSCIIYLLVEYVLLNFLVD